MSRKVAVLPAGMALREALAAARVQRAEHIVAVDGNRIVGFARMAVPLDGTGPQTLGEAADWRFVIAPETSILNAVISRMSRRGRGVAIVISRESGIPRPADIVGVIDAREIADAVIANHYA